MLRTQPLLAVQNILDEEVEWGFREMGVASSLVYLCPAQTPTAVLLSLHGDSQR